MAEGLSGRNACFRGREQRRWRSGSNGGSGAEDVWRKGVPLTPFYPTLHAQCHPHPVQTAVTPALALTPGMSLHQTATVRTNSHIGTGMVFPMTTYWKCVNNLWEYLLKYHKKTVSRCSHHLLDVSMTHSRRNVNIWK